MHVHPGVNKHLANENDAVTAVHAWCWFEWCYIVNLHIPTLSALL